MNDQLSGPQSGGTAYAAAGSGIFLALLSGMPIAIAVYFANQDGQRGPWPLALAGLCAGAVALLAGSGLVYARKPSGAVLVAAGSVFVLAGSIAVVVAWKDAYGNVAYLVVSVAVVSVVVFALSVLPKTRSFLRQQARRAG